MILGPRWLLVSHYYPIITIDYPTNRFRVWVIVTIGIIMGMLVL